MHIGGGASQGGASSQVLESIYSVYLCRLTIWGRDGIIQAKVVQRKDVITQSD